MSLDTKLPTVVPSARLVAALRRAAARERLLVGGAPWYATEHLTFSSWVERTMQRPRLSGQWPGAADFVLTPGQAALLWEAVVSTPLTEAFGAVQAMAAAQLDPLSTLAAEAHRLLVEWGVEGQWSQGASTALGGVFSEAAESPEHRAMRAWLPAYRQRCAEFAACDPADLLALAATGATPPAARFVGFGQVGPTLQRLGVPPFDPVQPAISARVARFLQREDEISAACDWALACRERGVEGGIAVVLPDARAMDAFALQVGRYHRASAVPSFVTHQVWAGAGGVQLATLPMIAHALLLLGLPGGLRAADVTSLIMSPYVAGFREEAGRRSRLVAALMASRGERGEQREAGDRYSGAALAGYARATCPRLASALDAVLGLAAGTPARQSLQAWMAHARHSLLAAGWPGEQALDAVERAASDELARAFDDTSELDAVLGTSTARDALHRLRRVLRLRRITLPVAANAIELLTLEEAVALKPAAVWVLGLNDSLYPRQRMPTPLLPQRLLREAGVPGSVPARDLDFDRACLAQLCTNAREVKLSCAELEGESKLRPSPGLLLADSASPALRRLPQRWREPPLPVLESRPEEPPVPFPGTAEVDVRGGTRVLADQAACPFRAFASYRLQPRPLELKAPGPDARERGTLVHAVMAAFWRKLGTQANLLALDAGDLAREIEAAVTVGLAVEDPPLPAPLEALERERLQALLGEWLAQEARRKPFRVLEVEAPTQLTIGGLRFALQIDRIDEVAGAEGPALFIVDYKTGNPEARVWKLPRPEEPQLPLYALARASTGSEEDGPVDIAGIGFARMTRGKTDWVTLPRKFVDTLDPPPLAQELADWRDELENLAAGFRRGEATVDPKRGEQTCRYCAYTVLCRRHEAAASSVEDDTDEHE